MGVTSTLQSDGSKLTLYTNDMLLYRQVESPQDYQKQQDDIHSISEWVSANRLHLNVTKCKSMLISWRRTHLETPPLSVKGHTLEQVQCFKYLGLLVTSDLSWCPQLSWNCMFYGKEILGNDTLPLLRTFKFWHTVVLIWKQGSTSCWVCFPSLRLMYL